MKRIVIAIIFVMFAAVELCSAKSYYNPKVNSAINMYKHKNYTECVQVMYEVVAKDPSNVLAYYYIAISEARLGKTDKAKEAYQRVIDLNSSTQLSRYSQNGIDCLNDSTKCRSEVSSDPTKKAIESVNKQMEEGNLESIKGMVNQGKGSKSIPPQYYKDFKDYSNPKNQIQNKSGEVPTKEEIADALDTLKRAGYQNYMPQPAITPEMAQINMINSISTMENPNSYNQPNYYMMPYMNQQNMSQMDPQLLQTMMTTSMMNGF